MKHASMKWFINIFMSLGNTLFQYWIGLINTEIEITLTFFGWAILFCLVDIMRGINNEGTT